MGFRRPADARVIGPENLTASLQKERYCFETFMMEPLCYKKGTLTAPGGTSLDAVVLDTGRYRFEFAFLGDFTDTLVPSLASEGGYDFGVLATAVAAQGAEVLFGGLKDGHPRNFIPANEDWFARVLLITSNASGIDAFFGFRKVAAYALTLTEYTDFAGLRILGNSASTDAVYTVVTVLNNAGATDYTSTTTTVTGLEDATVVELEVRSVAGKAFYLVNQAQVDVVAAYTFDASDVLCPVLRLLQTTDLAAQVKVLAYEAGPLADRQGETLNVLAGTTT